jgi:hypothetical protein
LNNEDFWKMMHEGDDLCKVIDEETKTTRCAWEDWQNAMLLKNKNWFCFFWGGSKIRSKLLPF